MGKFEWLLICAMWACSSGSSALWAASPSEKPLAVTFTNGVNGAPRTAIFVAGECIYLKVIAKNYPIPDTYRCTLSVRYHIVDKDDKIVYTRRDDKIETTVAIGKTDVKLLLKCPVDARLDAGEYTFVAELKDIASGQVFRNRQSLLIIPWDEFAISQFCFSSNNDPPVILGPSFEVGQPVILHFVIQSPQADDEGNWRLDCKARIFNQVGKNVAREYERGTLEVPSNSRGIATANKRLYISLPGIYQIEMEVKDLVSGKVVKKSVPFRVVDSLEGIPRDPTL